MYHITKNWIVVILALAFSTPLLSQLDSVLIKKERNLLFLLDQLRDAREDDAKIALNNAFKDSMILALEEKNSFSHPFSSLYTVGFIASEDKEVRIINWNVEMSDFSQLYTCLILKYDKRRKKYRLSELIDNSSGPGEKPTEVLDKEEWYGALYYSIIPFEKGSKDMYILLGWDGNSSNTNMKLIDVLYFSGSNPKLGSPVFVVGSETFKRVFYEHSEKCTMSLRYDAVYERILFDHLSPESPSLKGFYAYYVPDMSYDSFSLSSGKWVLKEDVIAVNKKTADKINIYAPNEENGVQQTRIKNKWIDPTDGDAPAGGNVHTADLPEGAEEVNAKTKKERRKLERKKARKHRLDKRDPSDSYPYSDLKKMDKKRRKK
ncbi:MAG: hypothetical protein ACI9G9_000818 [Psychromonas sp.]|jgi:hypothetical protein